jgi:hypothetical protein
MLIESEEIRQLNSVGSEPVGGCDMGAWDVFSRSRWSCRLRDHSFSALSNPFHAMSLDWSDATAAVPLSGAATTCVPITSHGRLDCIVAWYTLLLDKESGACVSTAPTAAAMRGRHWRQAVFLLPEEERRLVSPPESLAISASYLRDRLVFHILHS